MTEEEDLQAQIAALSGRINLHKQQQTQGNGRGGRGRGNWYPQRGTPYGSYRVQKTHTPYGNHRHRTLVLNNSNGSGASTPKEPSATSSLENAGGTWVSKRDRHMQLINASVYDQVSKDRNKAIAETMNEKQRLRNEKQKARLQRHFVNLAAHPGQTPHVHTKQTANSPPVYSMEIEGIPFRITEGGSKLVRIRDGPAAGRPSPKKATVAGVTFFRSKNGNLYRSGIIKSKKAKPVKKIEALCPRFTSTGRTIFPSSHPDRNWRFGAAERSPPFGTLTSHLGQCLHGPNCRFTHDPEKVAICREFLAKGSCPSGDACDLSHSPNPHRVPACLHFLRGNCTNEACRYAHVKVSPSAPVCTSFARLGYCEKGAECAERHVFECPDYANKGTCRKTDCRLPHIDHAGQIRRAQAAEGSETKDSPDLSSDEELDDNTDDVDSEEEILGDDNPDAGLDFHAGNDFIKF